MAAHPLGGVALAGLRCHPARLSPWPRAIARLDSPDEPSAGTPKPGLARTLGKNLTTDLPARGQPGVPDLRGSARLQLGLQLGVCGSGLRRVLHPRAVWPGWAAWHDLDGDRQREEETASCPRIGSLAPRARVGPTAWEHGWGRRQRQRRPPGGQREQGSWEEPLQADCLPLPAAAECVRTIVACETFISICCERTLPKCRNNHNFNNCCPVQFDCSEHRGR